MFPRWSFGLCLSACYLACAVPGQDATDALFWRDGDLAQARADAAAAGRPLMVLFRCEP